MYNLFKKAKALLCLWIYIVCVLQGSCVLLTTFVCWVLQVRVVPTAQKEQLLGATDLTDNTWVSVQQVKLKHTHAHKPTHTD
jgi:hypothetical protein